MADKTSTAGPFTKTTHDYSVTTVTSNRDRVSYTVKNVSRIEGSSGAMWFIGGDGEVAAFFSGVDAVQRVEGEDTVQVSLAVWEAALESIRARA